MAIEHNRVRFGVFEVDRYARELRKHGVRIKLADEPFESLWEIGRSRGVTQIRTTQGENLPWR